MPEAARERAVSSRPQAPHPAPHSRSTLAKGVPRIMVSEMAFCIGNRDTCQPEYLRLGDDRNRLPNHC